MTAPVAVTNANIITFITTDPLGVGFAAIRSAHPGDDNALIAVANNASGAGSGTVAGDPMAKASAFSLIAPNELTVMTTAQETEWAEMIPDPINFGDATVQADLNLLFAEYATSLAAFQAKYTRAAGPWEVYFGKGNLATAVLLDAARNSGSGNNF